MKKQQNCVDVSACTRQFTCCDRIVCVTSASKSHVTQIASGSFLFFLFLRSPFLSLFCCAAIHKNRSGEPLNTKGVDRIKWPVARIFSAKMKPQKKDGVIVVSQLWAYCTQSISRNCVAFRSLLLIHLCVAQLWLFSHALRIWLFRLFCDCDCVTDANW